jgi:hypothetical protein
MAGMLRVQRSRGALSGVLLVLLGLWGGLVPFVGPYVDYAFTPDRAWTYTSGRFWLELLPAIGAVVGGLILLASRLRPAALFGAWLAALSGCWFAIGGALAPLWAAELPGPGLPAQGTPVGGPVARAVEQIGFFTGLGVVIVFVATLALGRLSVLAVRDVKAAEPAVATAEPGAGTAAEPTAPKARWVARTPARTGLGTGSAGTQPATAEPARHAPAKAVLTRVFPGKTDRGADGTTDSSQAEVSSGSGKR